MYIVCETLGGDDPRMLPGMERLYSHWVFTTYFVPDELRSQVNLDDWDAEEVTESVAKAVKFGNTNSGKIGVRTGSPNYDDIYGSNSLEPVGQKTYYYITPEDDANTAEALKSEMKIYLKKHYEKIIDVELSQKFATKKQQILDEINACETILDCQKILHFRFGIESSKLATTENWPSSTVDLSEPGLDNF